MSHHSELGNTDHDTAVLRRVRGLDIHITQIGLDIFNKENPFKSLNCNVSCIAVEGEELDDYERGQVERLVHSHVINMMNDFMSTQHRGLTEEDEKSAYPWAQRTIEQNKREVEETRARLLATLEEKEGQEVI